MINKVNMDGVKGYGDGAASVPKGGYVCKILGVAVKQNRIGQYLEVSCDIAEGEYKGIFADDYRSQPDPKKWHCVSFVNVPRDDGSEKDGWTKRSFATFIEALEGSNPGYHFDWDETKIKGLMVGGIFANSEWADREGNTRSSVSLVRWTTVEKIRTGKFKIPDDKKLKAGATGSGPSSSGFMTTEYTPVSDSDLPF